jgi:hypothetical protein
LSQFLIFLNFELFVNINVFLLTIYLPKVSWTNKGKMILNGASPSRIYLHIFFNFSQNSMLLFSAKITKVTWRANADNLESDLDSYSIPNHCIQGDSYCCINILTSGRFRSQKILDNKILCIHQKLAKITISLLVNAILR